MSENSLLSLPDSGRRASESNQEEPSLVEEAYTSAFFSGVQNPYNGLAQLVNNAVDSNLVPEMSLVEPPKPAEFGTTRWHVQTVSGAVGMVLPFMVARQGARGLMHEAGFSMHATRLQGANMVANYKNLAVAEGALTGFIFDSAMRPVAPGQSGLARIEHGINGALTFGFLTKTGLSLNTFSRQSTSLTARALRNPIVLGTAAGAPAGVLNAGLVARTEGLPINGQTLLEGGYTFAIAGGVLSAAHARPGQKLGLVTEIAEGKRPLSDLLGTRQPARPLVDSIAETSREVGRRIDTALSEVNPLMPELAMASVSMGPGRGQRGRGFQVLEALSESGNRGQTSESLVRMESRGNGRGRPAEVEGVRLTEALEKNSLSDIAEYVRNERSLRNIEVKEEPLGFGNDSPIVLEVLPNKQFPDGAALKVTIPEGGWEASWGKRPRDAQLLGKKVHEIEIGENGATAYLYFQELVDVRPRYDSRQLDGFFTDVEKVGLSFEDPGGNPNSQLGISRRTGELVLIDYPSVGEPGHKQTLTDIMYGRENFEAETDVNLQRRMNEQAKERAERQETEAIVERERARQELRKSEQLTQTEREMMDQLLLGVTPKEVAEYFAFIEAAESGGTANVSGMLKRVNELGTIARQEGLMD